MRLIFLDAGPLGLIASPRGGPRAVQCWHWAMDLLTAGAQVVVPEVADYEVRRKLLHLGSAQGVRRLDQLKAGLEYDPITTDVMLRAAALWAAARRSGLPTAPPEALDADAILAAQALQAAGPGDVVTIATTNVRHLGRFPGIDARAWETIAP